MKIVVRVDISKEVGTGHFFRVLKFLSIFKNYSPKIFFIIKKSKLNFEYLLNYKKIKYKYINSNNQKEDLEQSKKIIRKIKPNFLIVDNYSINFFWEKKLKNYCKDLIVIDDHQNKKHICDYYINQNFIKNKMKLKEKIEDCKKFFLGPKYLIHDYKKKIYHSRKFKKKKIAIFMGGYDKLNYTKKIINLILKSNKNIEEINAFVGFKEPPKIHIFNKKTKINFLPFSKRFLNKLANNDILISSGGTVLWDKCLINIPSITIPLAENQKYNSMMLDRLGATVMVNKLRDIPKKIDRLNKKKIKKMKLSTSFICDYNSLSRIKEGILNV